MNTTPCEESRQAPTVTFRLPADDTGRAYLITLLRGEFRWKLDEPNARPSRAYPTYLEARAAARLALGLPAIGGRST